MLYTKNLFKFYHVSFCSIFRSPIVVIGRCLGAFSRAYPDPFLEKRLFGFDLESLLSQLDVASTQGSTAGNVLYVVDIVIPVLSKLDLVFELEYSLSDMFFPQLHCQVVQWKFPVSYVRMLSSLCYIETCLPNAI